MSEIGKFSGSYSSMLQERLLGRTEGASKSQERPFSEATPNKDSGSFLDTLSKAIEETNQVQVESDQMVKDFALGKASLHEVMVQMEKADVALRSLTAVRGKLIEAYQEIMRMPL